MQFTSIEFILFLPIVFIGYWYVANSKIWLQNIIIVISSYIFYGWWDWRFLFLIALSTVIDYSVGVGLGNTETPKLRRVFLLVSVFSNLSILGFFKYYNFFIESFITASNLIGLHPEAARLSVVLPVGISFYTFQTMSYSIDVYNKKMQPTRDFIAFTAYVSFFPQLVAGPIERAVNLLPQFLNDRKFDYKTAVDGMKQILWGTFKKIVIADNCAVFANLIFSSPEKYSGSSLLLGSVFFAFQIYGDFSGYSDIAIGVSKLFGFQLMKNFAFPYFSRDIAEFWRRWHISLSTWFRDYVYIPLGGSKCNTRLMVRNTFIIFLLSGLWHGANWTFVAWGGINALYFIPLLLTKSNRNNLRIVAEGKTFPSLVEFFKMGFTFFLVVIAWVFFRARNISEAMMILSKIFSIGFFEVSKLPEREKLMVTLILVCLFIVIEWFGRKDDYAIQHIFYKFSKPFRHLFYYAFLFMIFLVGGGEQQFIYFQF